MIQIPEKTENFRLYVSAGESEWQQGEEGKIRIVRSADSVQAELWYSVSEKPLCLCAPVKRDSAIQLTVRPYRIELTVDGVLWDEEWPWGEPCWLGTVLKTLPSGRLETLAPEDANRNQKEPAVLRSFEGLESLTERGIFVGDCMPFSHGMPQCGPSEVFHLFYLYDRHHHRSKWGLGAHQWAHISTRDLRHWEEHPMAVAITEPWEGSICTGSIMKAGEKYYAWYAVRMSDRSPARLTCAVSEDGFHFTKSGKWFVLPEAYEPRSARDPMVFEFEGSYHMLVTTTHLASGKGCLAHLRSEDLEHWEDCGTTFRNEEGSQPECSDWFCWNGTYYLICGIHGKGIYRYSDQPFGPWTMPENPLIPCGNVPKSAMLGTRRLFAGFIPEDGYAGKVCMLEAFQNADKTLHFEPVDGLYRE